MYSLEEDKKPNLNLGHQIIFFSHNKNDHMSIFQILNEYNFLFVSCNSIQLCKLIFKKIY